MYPRDQFLCEKRKFKRLNTASDPDTTQMIEKEVIMILYSFTHTDITFWTIWIFRVNLANNFVAKFLPLGTILILRMLYSFSFSIVDKSCMKIIFFFMSIKRGSSLLRLKHDFLSSLNQASSLSQFMDIGLVCIYMSSPGLCMMCTWRVDEMLAARFQTAPFCVAKNMQFWRFLIFHSS